MRDFHQAVTAITKQVVSLVDKNPTPIILIDGRAASGKSSLAADLKNALFKELEQAPRPKELRHARWIERDGEKFNDYWHIWAAQEDEFYQQEKSKQLADLVIEN